MRLLLLVAATLGGARGFCFEADEAPSQDRPHSFIDARRVEPQAVTERTSLVAMAFMPQLLPQNE